MLTTCNREENQAGIRGCKSAQIINTMDCCKVRYGEAVELNEDMINFGRRAPSLCFASSREGCPVWIESINSALISTSFQSSLRDVVVACVLAWLSRCFQAAELFLKRPSSARQSKHIPPCRRPALSQYFFFASLTMNVIKLQR